MTAAVAHLPCDSLSDICLTGVFCCLESTGYLTPTVLSTGVFRQCWKGKKRPWQHPVTLREKPRQLFMPILWAFLEIQIYQFDSLLSTKETKLTKSRLSPRELNSHFLFYYLWPSFLQEAGPVYLYAPEVAMLWGHMNSTVTILVHFIQRDALLLHELKKPQQNLLL